MSETLKSAGLPIPSTWSGNDTQVRTKIIAHLAHNDDTYYVAKPCFGWGGKDVMRFSDINGALQAFQYFDKDNTDFIIQDYIEANGQDYRAYVIGDQVIGSIVRKAKEGDWRGNAHQGALSTAFNLNANIQSDAVKALHSAKLKIGAVDILINPVTKQHYICEINDCAGTDTIENNHPGLNIAKMTADYLEKIVAEKAGAIEPDESKPSLGIS